MQTIERQSTYRSQGNYEESQIFGGEYEIPFGPSETIPDQSRSVQELIERHQRGQAIRGGQPVYYNDEDVPEIEKMDFAEKRSFYETLKTNEAEILKFLNEQKKEAAAKAKADELEAEILKRASEKPASKPLEDAAS